ACRDRLRGKAAEDSRIPRRFARFVAHPDPARSWSAAVLCRFLCERLAPEVAPAYAVKTKLPVAACLCEHQQSAALKALQRRADSCFYTSKPLAISPSLIIFTGRVPASS